MIDDSGDATARIAALTANQLTGLGMTQAGIAYGGIAALYVRLGSGVDKVNVASTHSGTTNINGGPGSDTFTVTSISGATEIQGDDPSIPTPEIFTNLVAATSVTVQQLLSAFTVTVVVNGVLQSIGANYTLAVASQQIEFVHPVTGAVEVLFSETWSNLDNATYVLVHPILDSTSAVTVLLNGLTQTYGRDYTFALGTQRINFNNPVTGTVAVEFNDPTEPSAETFANLSAASSVTVQPILMGAGVVSVLVNNVPQIFGTDYTFALGTQQIDFLKPVTGTVQVLFTSNYVRNPAVSQTQTGHTDSFLVNVTASGAETHQNGVGALLAIDPQFGTNTISVYLTGKTNPESAPVSVIDVHDSGPGTDVNTLQIYGANNPQVGDQFLVRANFVAMLQLSGGQSVAAERVNYDSTANGGVIIYGRQGNDYFALDDTSAPLSIIGGQGSDVFQVGQLYNTRNIDPQYPFDYDTLALTGTTQGFISNGVSEPATLQGGIGDDTFTVFRNLATLTLIGGASDNVFTVRSFALTGSQPDDTARKITDILGGGGANLIEYAVDAPVNILGGAGTNTVVVLGSELGDTFMVTPQGVFGAGLFASMTGIQYLNIDGLAGDNNFEVVGTDPGVVTHIYGGVGSNTFDVGGTPNNQPTQVAANDQQGYSQLISQTTTSSDSSYQGITVGGISANVTDADQAGVVITPIGLMQVVSGMTTAAELNQAGGDGIQFAEYSVVLSRDPQADQCVQVTVSGDGLPASEQQEIEFYDPTSGTFVVSRVLTFNSTNWSTPQTVYVAAPFNATTPGAQQELTQDFSFGSGGGESASFNLSSAASAIIAVSVSGQALASSEYSLSGLSLSLNLPAPAAPNAPVMVVYLSPDGATSTQYIQNSVTATNPVTPIPTYANYVGVTARSLPLEVVASSAAGVVLTPTDPTSGLAETGTTVFKGGAADAFTVVLTRAPLSGETVTVNLGSESGLVFTESGTAITSLSFNSNDWSVPVLVNVSDPQDNVIQGQFATTITASVTTNVTAAGGSLYAGIAASLLPVTVVDDNSSGVFTQQTGGSTDLLEGGTLTAQAPFSATYTVVLTKRPSANVTVIESPLSTRTGGTLTEEFPYSQFVDNQITLQNAATLLDYVSVAGQILPFDDYSVNGQTLTLNLPSAPPGVALIDVKYQFTGSADNLVLSSPAAVPATGQQGGAISLTFTPMDWNVPQMVTVTAVDDGVINGQEVKVFAAQPRSVAQVQGPLFISGGIDPSLSLTAPPPLLFVGESDGSPFMAPPNQALDALPSQQVNILNVLNDDSVASLSGTLTDSTITGLGMGAGLSIAGQTFPGGITYDDIQDLQIDLGHGNDNFLVERTDGGSTTIVGGSGHDQVNIESTGGPVTVNGGSGTSTIDVGTAYNGSYFGVNVNHFTAPPGGVLAQIAGLLRIDGGTGNSTVNLDDSGNPADAVSYLSGSSLQGLDLHPAVVQVVTVNHAIGGSFTLQVGPNGPATAAMPYQISAAGLQAALWR